MTREERPQRNRRRRRADLFLFLGFILIWECDSQVVAAAAASSMAGGLTSFVSPRKSAASWESVRTPCSSEDTRHSVCRPRASLWHPTLDNRPSLGMVGIASSAAGEDTGIESSFYNGGHGGGDSDGHYSHHIDRTVGGVSKEVADMEAKYRDDHPFSSSSSHHQIEVNWDEHKGAYAFLTDMQLEALTERTLSNSTLGEMSPSDLHELSRLMPSWSRRQVLNSGEMAERLLRRIIDEREMGNEKASVTVNMFNTVINAWAKCGAKDGPQRANDILDLLERMHKADPTNNVTPETKCYVSAIDGWCRHPRLRNAPRKAEEILERLGELPYHRRNVKHFNAVINAWSECAESRTRGENAERVLKWMTELYDWGEGDVKPNQRTYNTVIKAWAHTKQRGSARNAERIFASMERSYQDGNVDAKPDKISFTLLLLAWAKSRERGSGERAEELLHRMEASFAEGNLEVKPDTVTYNSVLNVWANSGAKDAGERSERLLTRMEQLYEMGDVGLKPDAVSYNTVMNALANSAGRGAARRAERILEKMEELCDAGDETVKPDIVSYNSVMNAFAKSKEFAAAQKAEEILERMEQSSLDDNDDYSSIRDGCCSVRPDNYSYNIVISAWANSGDIFAAAKAEALLQRMKGLYEFGDMSVKPDVTTYNSVLTAWSRSRERGAPQKAERILEHMFDLYRAGETAVKPDVQSFSTVINAWSKSKERGKARQAERLLRKMEAMADDTGDERFRPNVYVYAAVLNTCAYTFGNRREREEALKIAIDTFSELQKSSSVKPNHVTYGTFLRVCRQLMSENDSRKKPLVEHVFRQCCRDGQVGESVLSQVYGAAPADLYKELLGECVEPGRNGRSVTTQDIPAEWTCNVREKRSHRQPRRRYGTIRRTW